MAPVEKAIEARIQEIASAIKNDRPGYRSVIDFYCAVFLAQEESKKNTNVDRITIPPDRLSDTARPLIGPSDFTIDYAEGTRLLGRLCDLAQRLAPELTRSAAALKKAVQKGILAPDTLLSAITHDNDEIIHDIGESLGIPAQDLAFFAYSAVYPSITAGVSKLKTLLESRGTWSKEYCPICGNRPDMAFLDKEGARHLVCGFCMHGWTYQRMGCVFCGNRDEGPQHYFAHEEEKEYRVDLCEHCRKYLKLVDLRELTREFYPRLEQVATLHLDIKAKEMGYAKGID
jgi:FdhE protein